MRLRAHRRSITIALSAAILLPAAALAQQPDTAKGGKPLGFLTDTTTKYGLVPKNFTIAVGGFLPSVRTKVRLSSPSFPGTDVDLENKLGFKTNNQSLDIQAAFRLGQKQLITIGYFGFQRTSTKTINDTIRFGDSLYQAGATLDVKSRLEYYGLTYRYYFWRYTRWRLGAGLGIDALNTNLSLGIRVASGGGFADSAKRSGGFTAPAPMLGIYADWEFVPRFFLRGQLQYLYVPEIESYQGHITDDRLGVDWYPFHNYGIGIQYHYIGTEITKSFTNGGKLTFNYSIGGPSIYLTAAF